MGKLKGTRAALQHEMGERGEHATKLPARVERKSPVSATQELAAELIARFAAGETVRAICASDDRFPTPMTFRTFISRDEALAARWQDALRAHAEHLMEDILDIADADVKAPDVVSTTAKWPEIGSGSMFATCARLGSTLRAGASNRRKSWLGTSPGR
jgi:hypothetical protein